MTLWNLIRDFFVQNIFGGLLSNGSVVATNFIGRGYSLQSFAEAPLYTSSMMLPISTFNDYEEDIILNSISLGDWLSTTFTVITLILLVLFLYFFVKWIFKLFSGLLH